MHFKKIDVDDSIKPYGCWFQNDLLGDTYRRSQGKHFGLEGSKG